jgi:UDP-glucuronate 4-epimerase
MEKKKVLITGMAGFIGYHFSKKLINEGFSVVGIDNINNYYNVNLKYDRLKEIGFNNEQILSLKQGKKKIEIQKENIEIFFYKSFVENRKDLERIFITEKPDYVINLAAQAGVRYSIENPYAYIDSNIMGFLNILENCRHHKVKHLVFASSSSVYGANENMPFSVHHNVDHPVSLYAATKKSDELMAHTYSHLYKIPTTGLRFFTVYGPWGRPDMALFKFTNKIINDNPIDVYNYGNMKRDFTYIDDIVEGIYKVMLKTAEPNLEWNGKNPDPASSTAPYKLFNIGNNHPVELNYFIELIEKNLGKKAKKNLLPLQKGDVLKTYANIEALKNYVGFKPTTSIEEGIKKFIDWYKKYYNK